MDCDVCGTPEAMFVDIGLSVCEGGCGNKVHGATVTHYDGLVIVSIVEVH